MVKLDSTHPRQDQYIQLEKDGCQSDKRLIKIAILTAILIFGFGTTTGAYQAEAPQPPIEVIKTSVPAVCNTYRAEVEKYDWDIETAMKIMKLESGCSPTNHNYNDNHKNYKTGETICRGSYGLFQVGCIHYQGEDINDWKKNIEIAYRVYQGSSWNAWTTYGKINQVSL